MFCCRGGLRRRAAARCLLDWDLMREAGPKVLLGSSDITAAAQRVRHRAGGAHPARPMAACDLIAGGRERARAALRGRACARPSSARAPPWRATGCWRPGGPRGCCAAGNLSLIASMCGTRWQPSFDGAIAFLEDVGEEPYRIDRMLTQLLQAGVLDGVRGIALGSWER
ncbi:hypothetical protein [Nonomuraea rubra]|uniref:hypothetical protein n=1 Tax=Nonomuraea rubra TaxID=46180 RepID=UPI003CD08CBB